jgi:hypothetical protein
MYHDLGQQFCQTRVKHETTRYVSEYDTCQKVKADYMKPGGFLHPLSIPNWKWDDISMNFIVGLTVTVHKFDSFWVIVDRLTKSAHFILVNTRNTHLIMCYACTEFRRRSSPIEGPLGLI